jgi:DNA-binding response OmpR family regulator
MIYFSIDPLELEELKSNIHFMLLSSIDSDCNGMNGIRPAIYNNGRKRNIWERTMTAATANKKILVVDDEERMLRFIRLNLEHDGFQVIEAVKGHEALDKMRTDMPDLILLDVMLPDLDGFEVLKMVREISNIPVIMLTAKGEEDDRVRGLELGADDYVTKPFSPRELVSRVKAVLRRVETESTDNVDVVQVDDRLKIDFSRREIWVDGKLVKLRQQNTACFIIWFKMPVGY